MYGLLSQNNRSRRLQVFATMREVILAAESIRQTVCTDIPEELAIQGSEEQLLEYAATNGGKTIREMLQTVRKDHV